MPADTAFATKPQLGRQMLISAFAADVPCRWVTGDSAYWNEHKHPFIWGRRRRHRTPRHLGLAAIPADFKDLTDAPLSRRDNA